MALSSPVRFRRLSSPVGSHFNEFYEIYRSSLPVREQKTRGQIEALVRRPDYLTVLAEQGGAVLGFCTVFIAEQARCALLEYMAVRSDERDRGLGGRLFEESMAALAELCGHLPVLVEVDSEREESADREMRIRRKRFYRRLGCRQLKGLDYQLPLPGEGAPPQMDLLVYHPEGPARLTSPQLREWLEALYSKVYSCSSQDPRVDEMLAPLPEKIELV